MRPLQTIITGRKRWFFPILLSFLALSSCSKDVSHEAKVDHYYSILVQPPHDVQNASFDWIVHEFPEESNLTYSDLLITSGGNELTFLPDKAGTYIFEVVVFDGSERAGSKKYTFDVTALKPAKTKELKTDEPQLLFSNSEFVEEQTDTEYLPKSDEDKSENIVEAAKIIDEETSSFEITSTVMNADKEVETPFEPIIKEIVPEDSPLTDFTSSSYLTIQVSASPTLDRAVAVADTLVDLGFDAYIQKGYQEENETVWYRVRVGTFSTMTEARNASNTIQKITNFETWIDRVREDL